MMAFCLLPALLHPTDQSPLGQEHLDASPFREGGGTRYNAEIGKPPTNAVPPSQDGQRAQ